MAEITVLMYVPEVIGSSTLKGYNPEKGEDKDHTAWVPIDSCSFTLTKDVSSADTAGGEEVEHVGTQVSVEPITVKRSADYSTADLLAWLATKDEQGNGLRKEKILVDYVLASGRYYLRYELTGVQIFSCGLSFDDSSGDVQETTKFIYEKIRILQRPIDAMGEVDIGSEDVMEYVVPSSSGSQDG